MSYVLVVDDDPDVRDAMALAVEDAGYRVIQVEDGQRALAEMRKACPSIVLLDLMMPRMDGWQVVAEMDADRALAHVPVCIVSAQASGPVPRNVAVLKKPLRLAQLLETVAAHCGQPG